MAGAVTAVQGVAATAVTAPAAVNGNGGAVSGAPSFADWLGQALDALAAVTNQADAAAAVYAAGGPVTLDQVMVAEQQATLAVDFAVTVRDRALNAYQTIMNMQI
ncbi:hypothetical protein GCM10010885_00400 [Alicyclobacillus cellulosilyticus]|uniref:Flagellar hook-basal body complex protein FliE n=1 Tax=Alicyclobacillus cellulosilyticus TaxID=1003997 RepID=A0A917K0I4_9BACL|nr:flagellar hook-basal body complex protein FliE [Alicyclobacillus cellulosilyticus]GGI94806.1 hypothetical protein GCM10010885_00400 [Alicyclobacillus cellulosilyticus]